MKSRIAVLLGMISYLLIHGALSYRLPAGSGCSIIVFFYHSRLDPIIVMAFLFVENQTDAFTNSRARGYLSVIGFAVKAGLLTC